ncbi:flagellar hook-basal body complex protein FliE [Agaribacter marinus]|uniref:Flagellar hook-basal body complex protein FliE n=1 Tax=Agaribacter marinus TaxID=1431249 RepID=A0AA37SVS2_9ALTE|nr:flagellar hook-basal body complex protein FliE [Agaribacter marinus]GLR70012.1 flagellar hook-basal body complex protein FliE [Agaribacter marinus]
MTIEAVSAINATEITPSSDLFIEQLNVAPTQNFGQILTDGLQDISASLQRADQVLTDMALNKPISTHEVMIAMQEAKSELRLAVEVRNKLLEGYQEIMRMQV